MTSTANDDVTLTTLVFSKYTENVIDIAVWEKHATNFTRLQFFTNKILAFIGKKREIPVPESNNPFFFLENVFDEGELQFLRAKTFFTEITHAGRKISVSEMRRWLCWYHQSEVRLKKF